MAIITHRTSKNANYSDVLDYYTFKHEESQQTGHYEPILDEHGLKQERDNYAVAYIDAHGQEEDPELWAAACRKTNLQFRKNLREGDRKSHEYILSFPAGDREHMSMEDLMEAGKKCARENFAGYDCLIAVHRDTDNDHIHISHNSVRALQREEQEWMMKKNGQTLACEMEAGGKHQDSPQLRRHLNDWVLEECRQRGWTEKDNNAIADVHRAQRHGSKNDQMKAALLEAAGRSQNMQDLIGIMKRDYNMDMKASETGKTISVLYPGNEKYVRLRTLGLEPADLTRKFQGEQYQYTKETEEQQRRKEQEAEEKKKYIEWIRERRLRNTAKAEDTITQSEYLLAQELRQRGERYDKQDFQDLNYLIRQSSYLEANLQTELDKVDRLMDRWDKYNDPSLSDQERRKHGGYVKWCGCDPDEPLELADLRAEREIIVAEQQMAREMRGVLQHTAEQWRGHNNLEYAQNDLAWQKQRELQLKHQLKNIKKSERELLGIASRCEKAAKRTGSQKSWDNYHKFYYKTFERVQQQKQIEAKLRETKQKKKEAKTNVRQAKKQVRQLNR